MIRIAREFIIIIDHIKDVNRDLQQWVNAHPEDIPLDLYAITERMNVAVWKL